MPHLRFFFTILWPNFALLQEAVPKNGNQDHHRRQQQGSKDKDTALSRPAFWRRGHRRNKRLTARRTLHFITRKNAAGREDVTPMGAKDLLHTRLDVSRLVPVRPFNESL